MELNRSNSNQIELECKIFGGGTSVLFLNFIPYCENIQSSWLLMKTTVCNKMFTIQK